MVGLAEGDTSEPISISSVIYLRTNNMWMHPHRTREGYEVRSRIKVVQARVQDSEWVSLSIEAVSISIRSVILKKAL